MLTEQINSILEKIKEKETEVREYETYTKDIKGEITILRRSLKALQKAEKQLTVNA